MAPKKGKTVKKEEFDDTGSIVDTKNQKHSKRKGKIRKGGDSSDNDNPHVDSDDETRSKQVKNIKKKSKVKNKGIEQETIDLKPNEKIDEQSSIKLMTSSKYVISKKKQRGKGQYWDSDNEPDVNLLDQRSDSEDEALPVIKQKQKKKVKAKKVVEESEDSGPNSLDCSESEVESLTKEIADVKLKNSIKTEDEVEETSVSKPSTIEDNQHDSFSSEQVLIPVVESDHVKNVTEEPLDNDEESMLKTGRASCFISVDP